MLAEICGWFTESFDIADLKEAQALLDQLIHRKQGLRPGCLTGLDVVVHAEEVRRIVLILQGDEETIRETQLLSSQREAPAAIPE